MASIHDFENYALITIDSTKVDSDLTQYVVLLSDNGTSSNFPSEIWSGEDKAAKSDWGDVRFFADDGTTELPFEIAYLDNESTRANRRAEVYVKVGSVTSASDTDFYIAWGDSSLSLPARDDATWGSDLVWDDFEAVYHLDESANTDSGGYKDSTANQYDLTANQTVADDGNTSELNNRGLSLDGTSGEYLDYDNGSDITAFNKNFAVWARLRIDAVEGDAVAYIWGLSEGTTVVAAGHAGGSNGGHKHIAVWSPGGESAADATFDDAEDGVWHSILWRYDSDVFSIIDMFVEDVTKHNNDTNNFSGTLGVVDTITLGRRPDGFFETDVAVEEFRIGVSNNNNDRDWWTSTHRNYDDPYTFTTVGTTVSGGNSSSSSSNTPSSSSSSTSESTNSSSSSSGVADDNSSSSTSLSTSSSESSASLSSSSSDNSSSSAGQVDWLIVAGTVMGSLGGSLDNFDPRDEFDVQGITYDGTNWIAVGSTDTHYSSDGITWNTSSHSDISFDDVTHDGAGTVIAVGSGSNGEEAVFKSTDNGVTFARITSGDLVDASINSITFMDGKFYVIFGDNSDVYSSSDGENWTAETGHGLGAATDIASGGHTLVVILGGSSARSTDAASSWSSGMSGNNFSDITTDGGGTWWAVDFTGQIRRSDDDFQTEAEVEVDDSTVDFISINHDLDSTLVASADDDSTGSLIWFVSTDNGGSWTEYARSDVNGAGPVYPKISIPSEDLTSSSSNSSQSTSSSTSNSSISSPSTASTATSQSTASSLSSVSTPSSLSSDSTPSSETSLSSVSTPSSLSSGSSSSSSSNTPSSSTSSPSSASTPSSISTGSSSSSNTPSSSTSSPSSQSTASSSTSSLSTLSSGSSSSSSNTPSSTSSSSQDTADWVFIADDRAYTLDGPYDDVDLRETITESYRLIYADGQFTSTTEGPDSTTGRVYTSSDGKSWTARDFAVTGGYTGLSIAYDSSLGLWAIAGRGGGGSGTNRIVTSNNGTSWSVESATDFDTADYVAIADWNGYFYCIGDGSLSKVFRSTDGATWTEWADIGGTIGSFNVVAPFKPEYIIDEQTHIVVYGESTYLRSLDGGVTWTYETVATPVSSATTDHNSRFWLASKTEIYRSTDAGQTFPDTFPHVNLYGVHYEIQSNFNGRIIFGGNLSDDSGIGWQVSDDFGASYTSYTRPMSVGNNFSQYPMVEAELEDNSSSSSVTSSSSSSRSTSSSSSGGGGDDSSSTSSSAFDNSSSSTQSSSTSSSGSSISSISTPSSESTPSESTSSSSESSSSPSSRSSSTSSSDSSASTLSESTSSSQSTPSSASTQSTSSSSESTPSTSASSQSGLSESTSSSSDKSTSTSSASTQSTSTSSQSTLSSASTPSESTSESSQSTLSSDSTEGDEMSSISSGSTLSSPTSESSESSSPTSLTSVSSLSSKSSTSSSSPSSQSQEPSVMHIYWGDLLSGDTDGGIILGVER